MPSLACLISFGPRYLGLELCTAVLQRSLADAVSLNKQHQVGESEPCLDSFLDRGNIVGNKLFASAFEGHFGANNADKHANLVAGLVNLVVAPPKRARHADI
jgi:hypothetical protein